ncbi:Acetyl-coenzyme A carboxylase carboxyl transferase subunit beta [Clostridiales bacterium CHKCI001]|nr:Acetyl-coenzyme A carboxylase carboxyl transferase subunit beta [Clostridiales bacterium CHKCI001]
MIRDFLKKRPVYQKTQEQEKEPEIPAGLWKKCNKCGAAIYTEDVIKGHYICPKCKGYFRMHARRRIEMITDEGSFEEWDVEMPESNPLHFPGYEKKLAEVNQKTNLNEAIITGKAAIDGKTVVLGVMDARFFMGSMGYNVGEKVANAIERAIEQKLPVILFTCAGGARMQEGIVSLMQMAKTSAVLKRHSDAGLLSITVLTDPTTGGVTASFAMLGDVILSEPGTLIGFAGPRVIEQTIHQKLPEGFQRAEFLLKHGFLDAVVSREKMKETLSQILMLHESKEVCPLPEGKMDVKKKGITKMSAWDRVLISRMPERPTGLDYIERIFTDFIEFHGDRCFGDDHAIVGGIARFQGVPVTVIAQQKGKNTKDNIDRNFGMPFPEGYRKALRLMKQAEKFHRPIICFVDTPGAFCGIEAEERGQGEAIARNLYEMSALKVPVLSIFIGEGGSGGALAMAVADEVWMMENAIYSVLSPEGFASILWKDAKKAADAAKVMKITAADLKKLNIIDYVIREEHPATVETMEPICEDMSEQIQRFLTVYGSKEGSELAAHRYDRFRNM